MFRASTRADNAAGPRVAVVNESFVRRFGLGNDAVGRYMSDSGADSLNIEIIGVVKDAKYSDVKDDVPPVFFTPWRQDARIGTLT